MSQVFVCVMAPAVLSVRHLFAILYNSLKLCCIFGGTYLHTSSSMDERNTSVIFLFFCLRTWVLLTAASLEEINIRTLSLCVCHQCIYRFQTKQLFCHQGRGILNLPNQAISSCEGGCELELMCPTGNACLRRRVLPPWSLRVR